MNADDWVKLKANYLDSTNYKCDFQWRDAVVNNVAVRVRGSGSRNPIKPGLAIDFARFDSAQRFLGMQSIAMRNFAQDDSLLHERLTMEMFARLGLPYEREAHAKLFVNGNYAGLFLMVEPIDSRFLMTRFGETDGYLYEVGVAEVPFNFQYLGEDAAKYSPAPFSPKTHGSNPDIQRIIDMLRAANQTPDDQFVQAMSKYLDLGSVMAHVAAEQFMAEGDGFLHDAGMTNLYLYRRLEDDRYFFLVWDKEQSFASDELSIWWNTENNVLMKRALAGPELRNRYLATLLDASRMAGGPSGWMEQEAYRILAQIRAAAMEDPTRVCLMSDGKLDHCPAGRFEDGVNWVMQFARQRSKFVESEVQQAGMVAPALMLMPGAASNAASAVPRLAPGSLAQISIPLSETAVGATELPLPLELSGVSLKIGESAAAIVGVSPNGVLAQVPWELACGPASIEISDRGKVSNKIAVEIRPSNPGVFVTTHANGKVVDRTSPAEPGELVVAYATGLGAASEPQTTGGAPPLGAVVTLKSKVSARVGGLQAQVVWAGLTPGFAGLQQVIVEIPNALGSGGKAMLELVMHEEVGQPYALPVP